jgi:hypothetical protein
VEVNKLFSCSLTLSQLGYFYETGASVIKLFMGVICDLAKEVGVLGLGARN